MTVTDQSLLREWDLLQEEVVPSLLQRDVDGPPRSWSLGSVEDAASLAVAFDAAADGPLGGCGQRGSAMELYATGPHTEVGFRRTDLREIPDTSRQEYFIREDRRWFVEDRIAERILLEDPSDAVDVVTIRDGAADSAIDAALDLIRPGGRLVTVGDLREWREPDCLEHVASGQAGSVFTKRASGRTRPEHFAHRAGHEQGHLVETLARARAQRKLVEDHAKLAASLARRFAHHGEAGDDLEQVAMLALVKAAKRFDPSRDTRFATYATTSVLGELKRHFRDKSWAMRVPRQVQETYLSVKKAREELSHELSAEPTVGQIADRLGVPAEDVSQALDAGDNFWARSLDAPYGDDQHIEIRVEDGSFEQALDRLQMQSRMHTLDEQEQLVLRRLYFDELTQRQIAGEMGVSQMQVCRLQARALSKLRN